ncbi:MAG TPA: GDSL-type esterase/lipase family protein [Roseomonas sp.]|jgi:lysophospholipase L1-like esterase
MLHRRGFIMGAGSTLALATAGCAPNGETGAASGTSIPWMGGNLLIDPGPEPALAGILPVATGNDPYAPLSGVLRTLQRQRGEQKGLVTLIGDSHTAGPFLVERLRELFQTRFGSAGLGRLPPGRAQRYFNPSGFRVEQRGGWVAQNALRSSNPGPFGLTGYRLTGEQAGDSITLRMAGGESFDRVQIALMAGPDSGSFRIRMDGSGGPVPRIGGARREFRRLRFDAPRGCRELSLELAGDGPVELLGWGVERRARGVIVEGFGIIGATLASLDNRDRQILLDELSAMPPALLVLEFGTNEATDRDFDQDAYRAALVRWLRTLRTALPRTGLMLMGPADSGRPRRGLGCAGITPLPALRQIQTIQREVARAEGCAHFDWSAEVTHDPCRVPAMARDAPPMMQRDLVHFTADGYRFTADRLFNHIMRSAGVSQQAA